MFLPAALVELLEQHIAENGTGAGLEECCSTGRRTFRRTKTPSAIGGVPHSGRPAQRRRSTRKLQATASGHDVAASIVTAGGNAQAVEADLARPDSVPRLFDQAEEAFGPVDILINNADHWASDTFLPPSLAEGLSGGGDRKRPSTAEGFDAHAALTVGQPG
ncbi:MAG: SDR family NAD(P)-dependent oxidoreductase [Nocardioidaceae bacterium]